MMISVIVPVYNVARYLRACLSAIKDQSYPNWEAICVDDGSTDGSGKILDEYAEGDRRFKIIHKANGGVSSARNVALKNAVGEWVTFIDADDVVRLNFLELASKVVVDNNEADIVYFDNLQFEEKAEPTWGDGTGCVKSIDVSIHIPAEVAGMCVCGGLYKKTVLPKQGFKQYSRGEDLLFVSECLCVAKKVIMSKVVCYGYRQREGSAMHSQMTVRKLKDRVGYTHNWIDALLKSRKTVDPSIYRGVGLNLTEGFVYDLLSVQRSDQEMLWRMWYDNIKWMRSHPVFPLWTRFVIFICDKVHLRCVALFFCVLPHRLKLMGVHR